MERETCQLWKKIPKKKESGSFGTLKSNRRVAYEGVFKSFGTGRLE
jgi:hypothetical protein